MMASKKGEQMQQINVLFEDGMQSAFLVTAGGGVYEDENLLVRVGILGPDRIMDGEGASWGRFQVLERRPCRIEAEGVALI